MIKRFVVPILGLVALIPSNIILLSGHGTSLSTFKAIFVAVMMLFGWVTFFFGIAYACKPITQLSKVFWTVLAISATTTFLVLSGGMGVLECSFGSDRDMDYCRSRRADFFPGGKTSTDLFMEECKRQASRGEITNGNCYDYGIGVSNQNQ